MVLDELLWCLRLVVGKGRKFLRELGKELT